MSVEELENHIGTSHTTITSYIRSFQEKIFQNEF